MCPVRRPYQGHRIRKACVTLRVTNNSSPTREELLDPIGYPSGTYHPHHPAYPSLFISATD
jgi:hypothetical protein